MDYELSKCDWPQVSDMVLRPIDKKECEIAGRGKLSADEMYKYSVQTSETTFKLTKGEQVLAVLGCARYDDLTGIPWMLCSEDFKWTKNLLKLSKTFFYELTAGFPYLYNQVHEDNHESHRWLSWLGFYVSTKSDTCGMREFIMTKGVY
jgi:hypothetical protein